MIIEKCYKCQDVSKIFAKNFITIYKSKGGDRIFNSYKYLINERTEKTRKQIKLEKIEKQRAGNYTVKKGVPQVSDRVRITQQMAARGNPRALERMGQNFYFGNEANGIEIDRGRAFDFFRRAAEGGDRHARANYAITLFQREFLKI
jgi:hypothetical protein